MSQDSSQRYGFNQKRRQSRPPQRLSWPTGVGLRAGKRPRREAAGPSDGDRGLWIDKFSPTSSSDLCVAPKKVKEIRGWLEDANDKHSYKKLLILVGSPGTGKSTAVRVLCQEMGLSILQWNESFVPRVRGARPDSEFSVEHSSAVDSFREFLGQSAVGFRSLELVRRSQNSATSQGPTNPVILLEELPNLHDADAESRFRDIMKGHLRRTMVPTILIFSDVSEGKHRPQDLERLVDPEFLYSEATTIMQIHSVTKPKMKKILGLIAQTQGCDAAKTALEELHLKSGGDLRYAIMNMQLMSTGSKNLPKEISKRNDRDIKLSTFHALGKLLYAKRIERDGLSVLGFDPESILERSDLGVGGSLRFLGFHSPDFFSDISELSNAFDLFSDASTLLEAAESQGASSFHKTCASAIAGRAVANTNTQPTPRKFRQFSTPLTFDVLRKRGQNQNIVDQLSLQLAFTHVSRPSIVGSMDIFVTELLPSMRVIVPGAVEPVVDNLYSIAKHNARVVSLTTEYQKEQASLKEQAAVLGSDDIEEFLSDDGEEKPGPLFVKDDEHSSQLTTAPPKNNCCARAASVRLGDQEIIVIDD